MTSSEKHKAAADHLLLDLADGTCGCGECRDMIARALAQAERDGMKRAAEIARAAGQTHLDFAALGMPIEPSKIIAEDRARVADKIVSAILSEAGND